MQPIHELLARIRHDARFGGGDFELGYVDRIDGTIHRDALRQIAWPEGQRRVFEVSDESVQTRWIPYHRVRQVWKDGQLTWRRP